MTDKRITSTKLQQVICRKRPYMDLKILRQILNGDKVTVNQLASITGETVNVINSMSVRRANLRYGGEPRLNRCYPYPTVDEDGNIKQGPLFIEMDDKCKQFILESNV